MARECDGRVDRKREKFTPEVKPRESRAPLFRRQGSTSAGPKTPDRFGGWTNPSKGSTVVASFGVVLIGLAIVTAIASGGESPSGGILFGGAISLFLVAAIIKPLEQIRDAINAQTRAIQDAGDPDEE